MKLFKDDKREQRRIEKMLRKAKKHDHVAVGILQDEERKDGFSMAELAMLHEYGSPKRNIPARSFVGSTCDARKNHHLQLLKKLEKKVFLGRLSKKQALTQIGEVVSKDMVQTINNGIAPAIKTATVKRKKSSKPLVNTGTLKGAITHDVRGPNV